MRPAEVFPDRRVVRVSGEGVGYEYGAAVPTVREINADKQFFAGWISAEGSLKSLPIGEVYGRTVCD